MIIFGCNNLILAMKKDDTILPWTLNLHEKRVCVICWIFKTFKRNIHNHQMFGCHSHFWHLGCPWLGTFCMITCVNEVPDKCFVCSHLFWCCVRWRARWRFYHYHAISVLPYSINAVYNELLLMNFLRNHVLMMHCWWSIW